MENNIKNSGNSYKNENPDEILKDEIDVSDLDMTLNGFNEFRITDTTDIKPPIPVITINGEIISTEGNITTISGASKSGKSSFAYILIAGAISPDGNIDGLSALKVEPNTSGKAVLHFDTEQSRYDHKINLMAILRRSNIETCPEYFRSYNIRDWGVEGSIDVIRTICDLASKQFGGIHLIVIDGAADLLYDVNDPTQSNALVKKIGDIANDFYAPVIVIIHTNPNSDKERGHLGSQFQRKSESVLFVKNQFVKNYGDVSSLEPKLLRKAWRNNIPQVQFIYNKEKGYHDEFARTFDEDVITEKCSIENTKKLCLDVFQDKKKLKYGTIKDQIMKITRKGEGTAKSRFAQMRLHKMIKQDEDKFWILYEE